MQTEEFISEYRKEQLKEEMLPEELDSHFELLACIHVTEMHASFLLLKKETGEKYLLKRSVAGQMGSLGIEKEQLERIGKLARQSELDLTYWVEDGKEYLLRRYIEGQNLEEYLERHPVPEIMEVMDIAIQICGILKELHKMQPPIIHRDIKPQNLILDRCGTVHLIDFETSRNFDEHKQRDTRFYGTDITAAPEQYGYAQTDARTDIYAFGKVLCYLLTGDYQVEACRQKSGRLCSIVAKCCAFDPNKRYQTIAEVEKLLLKEMKRNQFGGKKKLRNILGYAAAAVLIFMVGIFVGRGMIWQDVETGEDLLYLAAAASLNKETVTEEDFKDIFCIAVI